MKLTFLILGIVFAAFCRTPTTGSPVKSISEVSAKVEPAVDTSGTSGDVHGLGHILDTISSDININNFKQFENDVQLVSKFFKGLMEISSPFATAMSETAKTNPKFRVMYKIIHGELPSLTDLFEMATSKSDTGFKTLRANYNNIPAIQKSIKIYREPNPDLLELLRLNLGKDGMTTETRNKYTQEFAQFISDNHKVLRNQVLSKMYSMPIDFSAIQQTLLQLDYSHFPKVIASNVKYTVSGGIAGSSGDGALDQKITTFLHDVQVTYPQILKGRDVASGAQTAVLNYAMMIVDIVALIEGKSPP